MKRGRQTEGEKLKRKVWLKLNLSAGFTLIELIVVIAIIGLLAALGLTSFRTARMRARDAQRKHDLAEIQRGLEMYYNDKEEYPASLPWGLEWRDHSVPDGALYMKTVPSDPRGSGYCYEVDSAGNWYRLYANLENENDPAIGQSGCEGDGCSCGGNPYNYQVASPNAP